MIEESPDVSSAGLTDEVEVWFKRISASKAVRERWEKDYRVKEGYQYWRGKQRLEEFDDAGDRRAQHNKIHPDVAEQLPSLYYYHPYGRVVAAPERSDTPGETVSEKARLLQDTGIALVRDKATGFRENTEIALKESRWAIGCVEVGYDPDFINNPAAKRPALKEKEDTKLFPDQEEVPTTTFGTPIESERRSFPMGTDPYQPPPPAPVPEFPGQQPGVDQFGLDVGPGSDLPSLMAELKRLRENLKGETFYVRHIPANQLLISPSDKPILTDNDWVGYWQDYPLEDVKASSAYENTEDLKATAELEASMADGSVDRVRLYRIWDLRTKNKLTFAEGHKFRLASVPFERCPLKFYREDVDPYHFFPVPPVYLKLPSQDQYNDSAEYMRKMRIGTVPRWTYDEGAIESSEIAKFMSRDFNIMVPRKDNTRRVIEPVEQPSTAGAAVQTLALAEKEFTQASNISGNPLDPPSQTATRVVVANAKKTAQEGYQRNGVAVWLSEIIEELILLAVENMTIERWVAMNVDLDSAYAMDAAAEVATTFQQIEAEKLRSAVTGITWRIEVEADTLTPVADAEKGQKFMQVMGFISTQQGAALFSNAPRLLKRVLRMAGITAGEDVDAVKEALAVLVQMYTQMAMAGAKISGVSPSAGEPTPQNAPPPGPPGAPPLPPGMPGA